MKRMKQPMRTTMIYEATTRTTMIYEATTRTTMIYEATTRTTMIYETTTQSPHILSGSATQESSPSLEKGCTTVTSARFPRRLLRKSS